MRESFLPRPVALLLLAMPLSISAFAQPPRVIGPGDPVPSGRRVEVQDGDTVVLHGDARLRIVRRSDATVRAIYNSEQRWLVLLVDYAETRKGTPDGVVDSTYTFTGLDGVWPLGERWQGSAVLEEYSMPSTLDGSLGFTAAGAFVQLFSGSSAAPTRWFLDNQAVALVYRGGGHGNTFPGSRNEFDQAEARAIADVTRNAQRGDGGTTTTMVGPGGTTLTSHVEMSVGSPMQPVRVGGNIAAPQKIGDARIVMPADAQQAGIRGVVILEIVVGVDGTVTDAKVLRSILPSVDRAAIDAVKQWRYTPTPLNGQPVPVIMTVTVAFP